MSESPPQSPRGKPATRRTMLSRRDALTAAERAAFAATIAERVDGLLGERRPTVLAMYAAKGSEVATATIDRAARSRGVRVVYPRIVGAGRRLVFCEVTLDEMVTERFGIVEPHEDAPAIDVGEIGAFLVPGVAFDRATGARLGWGRGHYDATLSAVPAVLRIGLAFEIQMIDGIAHEPHDVAMNMIVTEVATYVVA
ncbi:MAG: 5-formyltetrahydrofolate cyclo-ligase [Kofleriaceae bacterium]